MQELSSEEISALKPAGGDCGGGVGGLLMYIFTRQICCGLGQCYQF